MPRTAGSKNTAPVSLSALSFAEVEVPQITRQRMDNPFLDVIAPRAAAFLRGEDVKALSFSVPNENADQTIRLLGAAGREHGVTIRKTVKTGKTDTTITFWPAALQHRTRKGE